jgi:hypothetical protein
VTGNRATDRGALPDFFTQRELQLLFFLTQRQQLFIALRDCVLSLLCINISAPMIAKRQGRGMAQLKPKDAAKALNINLTRPMRIDRE